MDLKDDVLKKLNTTNLFSVTYRKDKFAISDKEYPIGYTSFLVLARFSQRSSAWTYVTRLAGTNTGA